MGNNRSVISAIGINHPLKTSAVKPREVSDEQALGVF